MNRPVYILFLLSAMSLDSLAQFSHRAEPKYEFQAAFGTTAFFGDIGGRSRNGVNIGALGGTDLSLVQPAYLLGIKRNYKSRWALRSNLMFSKLEGMDLNAVESWRIERNLSFSTPIIELNSMVEYSVVNFLKRNRRGNILEYYVFGGVGATYFNPRTQYLGRWVNLRPLGTEGQGLIEGTSLYAPITMVFPVGGGLRFNYSRNVMIFGELTYHQTKSDYLDDVSGYYYDYGELSRERGELAANLSYRGKEEVYPAYTGRGNPRSDDGYLTLTLGISKRLGFRSTNMSYPYIAPNNGMPKF